MITNQITQEFSLGGLPPHLQHTALVALANLFAKRDGVAIAADFTAAGWDLDELLALDWVCHQPDRLGRWYVGYVPDGDLAQLIAAQLLEPGNSPHSLN